MPSNHHIRQIKSKLSILGGLFRLFPEAEAVYRQRRIEWKDGQTDMLIDRRDNVINICEIRFSPDVFEIDRNTRRH